MKYRMITSASGTEFSAKAGDIIDGKDLPGDPDALVEAGWCVPDNSGTPVAATRKPKRTAAKKKAETR